MIKIDPEMAHRDEVHEVYIQWVVNGAVKRQAMIPWCDIASLKPGHGVAEIARARVAELEHACRKEPPKC